MCQQVKDEIWQKYVNYVINYTCDNLVLFFFIKNLLSKKQKEK